MPKPGMMYSREYVSYVAQVRAPWRPAAMSAWPAATFAGGAAISGLGAALGQTRSDRAREGIRQLTGYLNHVAVRRH